MAPYFAPTLLVFSLLAASCSNPSATNTSHGTPTPSPASKLSLLSKNTSSGTLPAPKTRLSHQQRSTKAFLMANGAESFDQIVDRWLFEHDEKNRSFICFFDGGRFTMRTVKKQFNRPEDDPLGSR